MEWGEVVPVIVTAIIAAIPGTIIALIALKKSPAEAAKTDAESRKIQAETDDIHAQVADRWAEHVAELQEEVKGLRLDIAQVRRENEKYRQELVERDLLIDDLRDWAARLVRQVEEAGKIPVKMRERKKHDEHVSNSASRPHPQGRGDRGEQ